MSRHINLLQLSCLSTINRGPLWPSPYSPQHLQIKRFFPTPKRSLTWGFLIEEMTQGRYCESCGWFHDHTQTCLFVHNGNGCSNIQTAVVDCTLTLGPPSTTTTRLSERDKKKMRRSSTSTRVSSFIADTNTSKTSTYSVLPSSNRRISGGGDTLLDRRCTKCDTTSTPLWRNGPRGPKVF